MAGQSLQPIDSPHSLSPESEPLSCYHCGLAVTTGDSFVLTLNEKQQHFCCAGCQAIASLVHEGGLEQFYQFRSEYNQRPDAEKSDFQLYDDPIIQQSFVNQSPHNEHERTAYLLLSGISCAACVWLIEKFMSEMDGLIRISVNSSSHICRMSFDSSRVSLSSLMEQLWQLGYRPHPYTQAEQASQRRQQQRQLLLRLGFAGFGMMQVGMVAVALYAGALQGIDNEWVNLLRWVSLLVATPIVLFSAQPFWQGAWRSLKRRHLTMDVPVSLAIVLAYIASAWATFTQSGEVYFDSIAMFTFFLLLGRFFELRLRNRNQQVAGMVSQLLPITANKVKLDDNSVTTVALSELAVGDKLRISSGETIAADGIVLEGHSAVIESVLTGEAEPVNKKAGDEVIAGTVNTDGTLLVEISAVGDRTRLSTIGQLVEEAELDKPRMQLLADKVASYFVAAVLIISVLVFFSWYAIRPEEALWITLSVLVVTCPCALSLATPTALTAGIAMMRRQGLLVLKGHVIESLTRVSKIIFDKTGTLSYGHPAVRKVHLLNPSVSESDVLAIAAVLEQGSSHPIAKAFASVDKKGLVASELYTQTAAGVGGRVLVSAEKNTVTSQGVKAAHYRLGKPRFAMGDKPVALSSPEGDGLGTWLLLSMEYEGESGHSEGAQALAWIGLSDRLRDSTEHAIKALNTMGMECEILSGDQHDSVKKVAEHLQVAFRAEQSPEQKLAYVRSLQANHVSMMVGDGINDVPVLAGADISVAVDTATDFARTKADSVLIDSNLTTLPKAITLAKKTKTVIRQNILWSLGYNLSALPLAALGYIPPYLAAIGMSASSLIVVVNALRLYRQQ